MTTQQRQVVIVGAGFAGVTAAAELAAKNVDVLLIDKNNYHQFQPLIYQVATAQIAVADVARPLRAQFHGKQTVKVKTAEITSIDPQKRSVTTADNITYIGETLLIATGAEANFFGVSGAAEHAFPLYSVDDAARLRSRFLGALDAADRDEAYIDQGALNVVVVGAGATGVETAGAVAESLHHVVPTYLPDELAGAAKVYLVDMLSTVLPPFSEKSRSYAKSRLNAAGVDVRLGSGVSEVRKDGVTLADGTEITSRTVVWAGGLRATSLLSDAGLPVGKGGRVDVRPDLTVPGFDGVYALGDAANMPGKDGNPLPQLGSVAQQSGAWAARNVHADITGDRRTPFAYRDKGIMAMVGRGAAVAEIGRARRTITGPVAFLAWLAVHVALLSGPREKIGAVISWLWDYCTSRRPEITVDRPDAYEIDWEGKS